MNLKKTVFFVMTSSILICPTMIYAEQLGNYSDNIVETYSQKIDNAEKLLADENSIFSNKSNNIDNTQIKMARISTPENSHLTKRDIVDSGPYTYQLYYYYDQPTNSKHFLAKPISYNGSGDNTILPGIITPYGFNGQKYNVILDTSNQGLKNLFNNGNVKNLTIGSVTPAYVENDRLKYLSILSFEGFNRLESISFDNSDFSRITNLKYAFKDCTNLKSANLKNLNVTKVNDFTGMFQNATSLANVDLSNWDMRNSRNLRYMFWNCNNLKVLDFRTVQLNESSDITWTFTTNTKVESVIVSDSHLLNNIDFDKQYNRIPLRTPLLNANGGRFQNGETTKSYFEKCVVTSEKVNLDYFEKFKQANQPNRSSNNLYFNGWQPSKNISSAKSVLDLLDVTYTAQWGESDWNFELDSSDGYYKLTGYIGTNTDIVVPNEIGGKPTKIDLTSAFPIINLGGSTPWTKVNSIRFSNENGKKVKAIGNQIWFNSWSNMTSFDGSGLDISNVKKLERTFENCSKLININIDSWNTSNITNIDKMFANCSALQSINLKQFNTENITNMQGVFFQCSSLKNLDLSTWNTMNVTNFSNMFSGCTQLKDLNIKGFITSNADNMQEMFKNCPQLKVLDLSTFVLKNGVNDSGIFTTTDSTELLVLTNDEKLKSLNYKTRFNRVPLNGPALDANGGKFSNNETIKKYFEKCAYEPDKINLNNFEKFKKENCPINDGFANNFVRWQESSNLPNSINSVLDLVGITYRAQWENADWEFEEDGSRILLTRYKGNSTEVIVPTNHNGKKIVLKDITTSIIPTTVTKFSAEKDTGYKLTIQDTNLNNAFDGNRSLNEVDFTNIDTSNITSMGVMFRRCSNLRKVNFSNCDISKVTSMGYMFQECTNLNNVDFTSVNTQSLNDTSYMFDKCINLKVIDLSSFSLKEGVNDNGMFFTPEKTELLVLTNNQKLQNYDYDKKFNRIPLKGPSFNSSGGHFENNQKIINYFETCAYYPDKITISEFNNFKNSLRPTREEFATNFVSWIPQSQEPSNVNSVLDLGNIVYKATWSDPNWDFTETDDKITLTKYKGQSTDITLVGELDGKNVELVDINTTVIPNRITNFIVKEKNNKKVSIKDKNLTRAFDNNKNLVEVNLSGLDGTSIQSLDNMFNGCSNLIKVTLDGMNTQNVTNFKSMFYECQKLNEVNISQLSTINVTDMSYLFFNCFKLSNINLSNWDTTKVTSMSRMFFNCPIESLDIRNFYTPVLRDTNRMFNGCSKLRIIRMDKFDMSKHTDSSAMFYRGAGIETLIVTNDNYLLNEHNFVGDNTHPLSKPILNANGGKFADQQGTKKYFDRSAVRPEKLQQSQFDQFKNSNIPTKDNAVFRDWTESGTTKTDEDVLNLLDKTYTAVWKNTICNTSPDNKKIVSTGPLGMVYLPQQFATNSTTLKDNGKQEILINKNNSFNIGVRDITQSRDSWSMTGQLKWNGSNIPGTYIQLDANDNSIKINQNDNVTPYDAVRDLTSANEEVMIGNAEEGHIKITSDSANTVMKATPEKIKDAIYDYNLGEVSLVIPDAGVVKDGSYSANLEWNLSNAPQ